MMLKAWKKQYKAFWINPIQILNISLLMGLPPMEPLMLYEGQKIRTGIGYRSLIADFMMQ